MVQCFEVIMNSSCLSLSVLLFARFSVPFEELFNNISAIQCTEVFEYAMSLGNAVFMLPSFHLFKYLYLLRLVDYGLLEEVPRTWLLCDKERVSQFLLD